MNLLAKIRQAVGLAPKPALRFYCSVCGRELRSALAIVKGIGPVCEAKASAFKALEKAGQLRLPDPITGSSFDPNDGQPSPLKSSV